MGWQVDQQETCSGIVPSGLRGSRKEDLLGVAFDPCGRRAFASSTLPKPHR